MKINETQYRSSSFLKSGISVGMLLILCMQALCVSAEEESLGFQDTLQSVMMRNQASVGQRLSEIQDEMIHKSYMSASRLIENETKEKMRVIELANESSLMQHKELTEAVRVDLSPPGVAIDTMEGFADNNTGGY